MIDDPFKQLLDGFKEGWNAPIRQSVNVRSRPTFWSLKTWRDQEQDDLRVLADQVRNSYQGTAFNSNEFLNEAAYAIAKAVDKRTSSNLPMELLEAIYSTAFALIHEEFFILEISEGNKDWEKQFDLKEGHLLKIWLKRHLNFIENSDEYFVQACEKLVILFTGIIKEINLPTGGDTGTSFLHLDAQITTLLKDTALCVERTVVTMFDKDIGDKELFEENRNQLWHNLILASGYDPCHGGNIDPCKCKMPTEQNHKTAEQVIDSYLSNTAFHKFFQTTLPIPVPDEVRFEHMHILAGTGHGKTQCLQHLIVGDLQRPAHEIPSMVILDSQGDMLNNLKRLAMFDPKVEESLAKRLLIVDPSDVEFAPSLNLFDIQSNRLKDYNQKDREQVLAGIIEIYDYIFGGLLGAELTQKQNMVFRFLAQLMLAIPGATIHTLRDLLIDASPFMGYVAKLPDTARSFFETQFFERGYTATREQILRRLYGVLQNPSFERMFASPQNRLDLFPVLNDGGIVLVNTAKDFMKTEASSIFGRYIIALTFKAAMERAILPEHERRPTYLWVDEASEYFDDNIDSLLIQARKFKLGIIMAHQYLGQLPRGLPASMMTNTSIKLAGGLSDKDNRDMAREMRTSPDFIAGLTKEPSQTNFAAYVRNVTPQAMKLTIPFGTAESLPRMSDESFNTLLNESRKRLAPVVVEAGGVEDADEPAFNAHDTSGTTAPLSDDEEFWEEG